MNPEPSAVRRYRDVMAEVTEAAGRLREQDRRRAVELRRGLTGLEDAMLRVGQRSRVSAAVVQLLWENALEQLWPEGWMQLRPRPGPDPDADPAAFDQLDQEVQLRAAELREAVRRRWYEAGPR